MISGDVVNIRYGYGPGTKNPSDAAGVLVQPVLIIVVRGAEGV